ncbi:MAG: PqqD family protein [Bacteroidota bacterium]
MNSRTAQALNLLDLKPARNARSETNENGLITLLVPKFQNQWIVRWLNPLLAKPFFRLNLDKYGSYIWNACDGNTTVRDIGEKMGAYFGEETDSLYERIGLFIRRLDESQSLIIAGKPNDEKVSEINEK